MANCSFCGSTMDADRCTQCNRVRTPSFDEPEESGEGLEGLVLADRYRLGALLGRGGMGRVYLAEQIGMQREVAVKVLRPHVLGDPSQRRAATMRFQREVLAVARLEHPNTVRVYDQGSTESGLLYLVMERLTGRTLAAVLDGEQRLPPARVAEIGAQVCRSLAEAHDRLVIHRDLKPDNVFLAEVHGGRERVKVLDFGIAKVFLGGDEQGVSALTRSDTVIGTAAYMAPEQATGGQVGPATDLYSLGVILYECLTGRLPYEGDTPIAVLMQHAGAPTPRVPDRVGRDPVPADLARVIEELLDKDPAHRPGPALEVATRLEEIARALRDGERRIRRPRAAARVRSMALAAGALIVGIGLGVWAGPGAVGAIGPTDRTCEGVMPPSGAAPGVVPAPVPLAEGPERAIPDAIEAEAPGVAKDEPSKGEGAGDRPEAAGRVEARRAGPSKALPPCRSRDCPFKGSCRDAEGQVWKGVEFCFPTF